jgi:hypothetical protein
MTFLPIAERELRVASRKRSTFWVRVIAAIVALVIGTGFFVILKFMSPFGSPGFGKGLFATLTWLSLAAALCAGLFFTSDCLSEEKREGTIGFLFLTDLRAYDVVLGKLVATSVRGFYALLAIFPILAITLMMGGVAGAQFWKTSLALVNALFMSLAAGLFVSAISRESQKALGAALLLIASLAFGGLIGDSLLPGPFTPLLSLSSPAYLFAIGGAWGKTPFWMALLINHAIGWALLGLTIVALPRTWQEKGTTATVRGRWWKFGSMKRQLSLRRKLMGLNPVLWLACRERWQALALWVVSLLVAAGAVTVLWSSNRGVSGSGMWVAWNFFGGLVTLLFYLALTSQACRFFVDAQRNGTMELLLASPLTVKQIIHGQWRAVLRMFALPVAVYLAVQFVAAIMASDAMNQLFGAAAATAPPPPTPAGAGSTNSSTVMATNVVTISTAGRVTVTSAGWAGPGFLVYLAVALANTLTIGANLVALIWLGMWAGLTSKNTNVATLKTMAFVQIIPWFAVTFLSSMVMPFLMMGTVIGGGTWGVARMIWYPLITSGVASILYVGKDVGFFLWARHSLYTKFRERAAHALAPIRLAPPPVRPATPLPPVIASA